MALHPRFVEACRTSLPELFRAWLSVAPVDLRRVMRPSGQGTYSISIETYRGSQTWIQFFRILERLDAYHALTTAIAEHQPELTHYLVLPGRAMSLQNPGGLVSTWCRFLEDASPNGAHAQEATERLLTTLRQVLETRTLTESIITAFAGVELPTTHNSVELAPGARLRALSGEELADLGAEDVTFGRGHDLVAHSVSTCFELQRTCGFSLEPQHPQSLLTPAEPSVNGVSATSILRALHVLKTGRAGVFLTKMDLHPKVLPNLGGMSTSPLHKPASAGLTLAEGEVDLFVAIEKELRESPRDELRIAADRLTDAENRLSKVDAVLDAVIGLEVLLNPMDASELAFRVALNYAFLGPAEHRRERYDRVRLIQRTRNRVVHGGLNPQSPDAATLHEHAALAIASLRDTLKSFLLDSSLRGNEKLDANFWLDRLFPVTVSADVGQVPLGAAGNAG